MADWVDLIGKPFRWGARGPDAFDCYGLVVEMNRRAGHAVPPYVSPTDSQDIARLITGEAITRWMPCKPRPGALITFRIGRHVSHVGYLLPRERFIHCWERTGGVTVERLDEWERRIAGYYEFNAP
jgi:cell wall-associated NlpC family hydrolase